MDLLGSFTRIMVWLNRKFAVSDGRGIFDNDLQYLGAGHLDPRYKGMRGQRVSLAATGRNKYSSYDHGPMTTNVASER